MQVASLTTRRAKERDLTDESLREAWRAKAAETGLTREAIAARLRHEPPETLKARWRSKYLPLIRVIEDRDLPRDLLDPSEVERVQVLEEIDPDDVPSVTLALAIEAFYLSEDGPALRAVYCLRGGGRSHRLSRLGSNA
jgi:hypothetical protein